MQEASQLQVLLNRYGLAAQLQAPACWRQRQRTAAPLGSWQSGGGNLLPLTADVNSNVLKS